MISTKLSKLAPTKRPVVPPMDTAKHSDSHNSQRLCLVLQLTHQIQFASYQIALIALCGQLNERYLDFGHGILMPIYIILAVKDCGNVHLCAGGQTIADETLASAST